MDPFEVRMEFVTRLSGLSASQQSIQKVVSYAFKYFSRCADDLWDCIVEDFQRGSMNARINLFYLLDTLANTSIQGKSLAGPSAKSGSFYLDFITRDLGMIVDYVVPDGREGLINLMSTVQILENWRMKRTLDPSVIEQVLGKLDKRKAVLHAQADPLHKTQDSQALHSVPTSHISRQDVLTRIEGDRERHKRLKERRWVQPIALLPNQPLLASFAPDPDAHMSAAAPGFESALDIEFDNEWETTSDWNEDDEEAIVEENILCYPNAEVRMVKKPHLSAKQASSNP